MGNSLNLPRYLLTKLLRLEDLYRTAGGYHFADQPRWIEDREFKQTIFDFCTFAETLYRRSSILRDSYLDFHSRRIRI